MTIANEKKTSSEASVSHPEGAGERVWQHDLPTKSAGEFLDAYQITKWET